MYRSVFVVLLSLAVTCVPQSAAGQEADAPGAKRFTALAGVENAMGWFGAQGEWYLASDRISGFAGLGYVTEDIADTVGGAAAAVGVRGYTPGLRHRGFLEASFSQVATHETSPFLVNFGEPRETRHLYGPGIQAGYQYVSNGGFSLLFSVGLGYALDAPEDLEAVVDLSGLGLGDIHGGSSPGFLAHEALGDARGFFMGWWARHGR